jgi:predicted metalloendopeptidase
LQLKTPTNSQKLTLFTRTNFPSLPGESIYLDQRFIDAADRFSKKLTGQYDSPPRSHEVYQLMTNFFPLVFDHLFVTECSSTKARQQIKTMVDDIQVIVTQKINHISLLVITARHPE